MESVQVLQESWSRAAAPDPTTSVHQSPCARPSQGAGNPRHILSPQGHGAFLPGGHKGSVPAGDSVHGGEDVAGQNNELPRARVHRGFTQTHPPLLLPTLLLSLAPVYAQEQTSKGKGWLPAQEVAGRQMWLSLAKSFRCLHQGLEKKGTGGQAGGKQPNLASALCSQHGISPSTSQLPAI